MVDMQNPQAGNLGAASNPNSSVPIHSDSTERGAALLALEEFVWRSDVVVLVAEQYRNGNWRRRPFLSLPAARNHFRRARRAGRPAQLGVFVVQPTHAHADALAMLARLDDGAVSR